MGRKKNVPEKAYIDKALDLICFLLDWLRSKNNMPKPIDSNPQLTCLYEYLEQHYTEKITIKGICDYMCMSDDTLNRLLKREIGRSLKPLLCQIRIKHAANLLKATNETVSSIGYMVGFGSESAFCEAFKKEMKTTPSRYRHSVKE